MEHYYFLKKNGTSQGPYKLDDLKKQVIQADDLVWRDNMDEWAKAFDLDELSDLFIVKSPPVPKDNLNDTKLYYFVQQEGIKKGPFKLSELKELTVYFDELVWRSDNDLWKKASEFEELSDIFIIKPPPTPKEKKIDQLNKKFISQSISRLILSYIITSFLIGIISFGIAQSSWEKYNGNVSSGRYKYFVPDRGYNNESAYGNGQSFWFRPFNAFGSKIYLTREEQNNSNILLGNLVLSSYASLSIIFLIIGIIYYAIKRNGAEEKPLNIKSNE